MTFIIALAKLRTLHVHSIHGSLSVSRDQIDHMSMFTYIYVL